MNPKVDAYLKRATKWPQEVAKLRSILLDCELTEEWKWGKPCYAFGGSNVVLIVGFKEHCALLFAKGVLLKDAKGILVKPGENTQATRQMRFTSLREIAAMESTLKEYVLEAIEVEKAGLEVEYKESTDLVFPPELQDRLDADPALQTAFAALTPGRQRAYNLYFSAPKQSKTRQARIGKCVPLILKGEGINDEYRSKAAATRKGPLRQQS